MFSKVNLLSSVTPRSLRELKTSRSSPHRVNGGWGGRDALDRPIVIECVLQRVNFISHVEHHDWILNNKTDY